MTDNHRQPATGSSEGRRMAAMISRLDSHRRTLEHRGTLGTADLRILWLFADGQARTLKQIAEELHLEQSTVNRQVNAAVTDGLLARARRPGGVAYEFTRTTEGLRIFEDGLAAIFDTYDATLRAMGEDDAARLLTLMDRFVDACGDVVGDTRETD